MKTAKRTKLLILVVAYNAESHIELVLDRIPEEIWDGRLYDCEVLIIDDASPDNTAALAARYQRLHARLPLKVLRNPVNEGYGGNQKIGYHYAIKNGFEVVALLHGDGQYAPELLPTLVAPVACGEADAVFGSRMLRRRDALQGGMPLYKFAGNTLLTWLQNRLLGTRLSEFHSGYRVYSVQTLSRLPFACNSNDFDFDTDIIIQLLDCGFRIRELPIPTYYGSEICYVNGLKYAALILKNTLLSRLQPFNIYYDRKFDYHETGAPYPLKIGFPSSHTFALDHVPEGAVVLDIGCGQGRVARLLRDKGARVIGVDQHVNDETRANCNVVHEADLDRTQLDFDLGESRLDVVLLLDIIEHLRSPETFLDLLRARFSQHRPKVILTTGNIAFFIVRLSLLLGQFNYGKQGILDLTHTRLFTFKSMARLLRNAGYRIEETRGIPVPWPLVFGQNGFSRWLLAINKGLIALNKSLFAYQIACLARPIPTLDTLLQDAHSQSTAPIANRNRQ